MATTEFELVTPTRTLYSGHAEMIVCRVVDGEIAFLANHMPYIGALDTGLVRIVGPTDEADLHAMESARELVNGHHTQRLATVREATIVTVPDALVDFAGQPMNRRPGRDI